MQLFNHSTDWETKKMELPKETDLNNLPINIAYNIWNQVILENQFTYEKTAELAKSFTTLNRFLQTDHLYPQIWNQFWNLAFGRIGWDRWMQLNPATGATWATSWKSFFFWCLLIERTCSRILLEEMVSQAYARAELEFTDPDFFFDTQGWQGPIQLMKRTKPILPKRWKYREGHLFGGTAEFTFIWPDESENIFIAEELMDVTIRREHGQEVVPIYFLLWVYLTFNGQNTLEPFEGVYPGIPDLPIVFEAFVRATFVTRQANDPYFVKISDRSLFPLNPLGQLNLLKDLLVNRPGPQKPLNVPRYNDEGQIYLGACVQCKADDAQLMDPSIQQIFCGTDCQRKYYRFNRFTGFRGSPIQATPSPLRMDPSGNDHFPLP